MQNLVKEFIENKLNTSIVLEKPKDLSFGHYATPVAFSLAKELKKSPMAIADELVLSLSNSDMFEKVEAATGAYFAGRCQAYTTDASGLASVRAKEAKDPATHLILPDLISKEPLGPMVRRGDDEWLAINKWVLAGLIEAE